MRWRLRRRSKSSPSWCTNRLRLVVVYMAVTWLLQESHSLLPNSWMRILSRCQTIRTSSEKNFARQTNFWARASSSARMDWRSISACATSLAIQIKSWACPFLRCESIKTTTASRLKSKRSSSYKTQGSSTSASTWYRSSKDRSPKTLSISLTPRRKSTDLWKVFISQRTKMDLLSNNRATIRLIKPSTYKKS